MNYEPGDIVTFSAYRNPYGDRRVRVTSKGSVPAGKGQSESVRPGFKEVVLAGHEEGAKVTGYDKEIIKVEQAGSPGSA